MTVEIPVWDPFPVARETLGGSLSAVTMQIFPRQLFSFLKKIYLPLFKFADISLSSELRETPDAVIVLMSTCNNDISVNVNVLSR